jgi:hypothetical protein
VAAHGAVYSAALAAGSTVEQMQGDKLLAAWPEWGGSYITADRSINTLVAAEPVGGLAAAERRGAIDSTVGRRPAKARHGVGRAHP